MRLLRFARNDVVKKVTVLYYEIATRPFRALAMTGWNNLAMTWRKNTLAMTGWNNLAMTW